MRVPKNPETGKPYEFLPESDELSTPAERKTAVLLVEMTHALDDGEEDKAEKIAQEIVRMYTQ